MKIFDFDDYRDYLKSYFLSLPKQGYGKLAELAQYCEMNAATTTLVIQKERNFTLDQAHDVCNFLNLSDFEAEYFFTSVELQKAGKSGLRSRLTKKLNNLKEKSADLTQRLGKAKVFDESARAEFYSEWHYSAVRLAARLPEINQLDDVVERLKIPRQTAQKVIDFLVQHELLKMKNGHLTAGVLTTHLGADSHLVGRHHVNWRLKTIESIHTHKKDELHFTSPLTIAKKDVAKVREILAKAIEDSFKIVDPSEDEELVCLSIDWFRF